MMITITFDSGPGWHFADSTDEVDDAMEFIAAANRVPTVLWHTARARGLLSPNVPLPPAPAT